MKKTRIICFIFNLFLLTESQGQVITANDTLIAQDSIHSVTYDEQTVWNAKRYLMQKLLADTTLVSGNALIDSFYSTYINDNMGALSKIRLALDTLAIVDSTTMAAIESNNDGITVYSLQVEAIDSIIANTTLSTDDIEEYNQEKALYLGYVSAYTSVNDSIYGTVKSAINAKAASINSQNSSLTTNKIYEQNEIDVNNIYLSTLAIGRADSLWSYATQLYNIASQCGYGGGPAVYYARNLYHVIDNSIIFDDDRICGSPNDTCLVPPAPGAIRGRMAGVCGQEFCYSIDTMNNVTGYTWSLTGNAAIDSGQGSTRMWVSFTDTFTLGTVSVYATDSCGSGMPRTLAVTGYPITPSVSGPPAVCAYASDVVFTIDSVEGATSYTWTVPSACTIDSGQGTIRIVVDWDSAAGNVTVVASNVCGSSDSATYSVGINDCRVAAKHVISASSVGGNIKIYPNPTTGMVTVTYHLNSENGILQLHDAIGNLVGSFKLDGNSNAFSFDASYLCCGIFEYRAMDNASLLGEGKLVIIR